MAKTQSHRERHELLHKCLDELVADFITVNANKSLYNTSLAEFIKWSAAETREGSDNE